MTLDIERAKRDGVKFHGKIYKYVAGPDPEGEVCVQSDLGWLYLEHQRAMSNLPDPIEQCRERGIQIVEMWPGKWIANRDGLWLRNHVGGWVEADRVLPHTGFMAPLYAAEDALNYEAKQG